MNIGSIEGFKIDNEILGKEGEEREVRYLLTSGETVLTALIENTTKDDVCHKKLLRFLSEKKVIGSPDRWNFRSASDSTGNTVANGVPNFTEVLYLLKP